jgi:ABC-2 type transport system ATP-binding protein
VIIIDHGRAIYDGSLDDLVRSHQPARTLVVDLDEALPALDIDGLTTVRCDGPRQWLSFDPASMTAAEAIARVSARAPLRDLTIEEPEVEEIIRQVYSRET